MQPAAPFNILKFYAKYAVRNGETVQTDWVDISSHGQAQYRVTPTPVRHLLAVRPDGDPSNPAWMQAKQIADFIRPHYEAWKKGQELPVTGTPLASWAGALNADQIEMFRAAGIRTVEDVAGIPDSAIASIRMPGVRDIQIQAKKFLDVRPTTELQQRLSAKDAEMAELREQLEEMRRIVLEREPDLAADGSEAPRRRGRPPRQPVDEAAA